MVGRENEKLNNTENRNSEKLLTKRFLTRVILCLVVMLGIVVVFLIISNNAQASVDLTPNFQSKHGEPGDTIDFNIKVFNQGNTQDIFYLTLQGDHTDWGEILDNKGQPITHIALNASDQPGSFVEIILRVEIPGAGETSGGHTYPILLKATSITTEGIEDQAQVFVIVDDYVDLILEYTGSGAPKKDYDPNKKSPEFFFRVTNNGNQPEAGITVRVDPTDWNYTPETIGEELEPGETTTFSLEFTIPPEESESEYDLQVCVVSSVVLSVKSDPVLITINITKPDLTIGNVNLPPEDEIKGKVNDHVTITATVSNEGHAKAESITVKLYEDGVSKDTQTISSIEPSGSRDVYFKWKVVSEIVELQVKVIEIKEIDTGNNAISPIYLDLRPDLSFADDQINFSNSNPRSGNKITITAFLYNGGGDAEDVVVKFTYGPGLIGTDTIDIDFGEVGEATFEGWEVPNKPGDTLTLGVEIDHSGAIGDGEEATKYLNVAEEEDTAIDGVFSWTLIGLVIGFVFGAIIFLILGIAIGSSGRRKGERRESEGMGGLSYAPYESIAEESPEIETRVEPFYLPPPPPPPPPPLEETEEVEPLEKEEALSNEIESESVGGD